MYSQFTTTLFLIFWNFFSNYLFSVQMRSVSESGRPTVTKETVFQKNSMTVRSTSTSCCLRHQNFRLGHPSPGRFETLKLPSMTSFFREVFRVGHPLISREVWLWRSTPSIVSRIWFTPMYRKHTMLSRISILHMVKPLQKDLASPIMSLFHNGTTWAYTTNKGLTR